MHKDLYRFMATPNIEKIRQAKSYSNGESYESYYSSISAADHGAGAQHRAQEEWDADTRGDVSNLHQTGH